MIYPKCTAARYDNRMPSVAKYKVAVQMSTGAALAAIIDLTVFAMMAWHWLPVRWLWGG